MIAQAIIIAILTLCVVVVLVGGLALIVYPPRYAKARRYMRYAVRKRRGMSDFDVAWWRMQYRYERMMQMFDDVLFPEIERAAQAMRELADAFGITVGSDD